MLSCLAAVQDRAKLDYLKDTVIAVMKAINEAADYIKEYIERNTIGKEDLYVNCRVLQVVFSEKLLAAQFRSRLDDFKKQFASLHHQLGKALLSQAVVGIDVNGKLFIAPSRVV